MVDIDGLDLEILKQLSKNARITIAELSNQIGVTRSTIQSRIRRLEEREVILAYRPMINLAAVGIGVEAFVALQIDQRHMDEVITRLKEMPEVLIIDVVAGANDLLARVGVTDQEHLKRFLKDLSKVDHIQRLTTTVVWSRALPYRTEPILISSAETEDFGRSTPLPQE